MSSSSGDCTASKTFKPLQIFCAMECDATGALKHRVKRPIVPLLSVIQSV